jgi:hypothetical protein
MFLIKKHKHVVYIYIVGMISNKFLTWYKSN